ncbi:hypothetical protein FRC12_012996 [Ceratobasidium sp. 428]|nr:hypothetical protein FRC12_012996 [Ceratobasidium sp. 428]
MSCPTRLSSALAPGSSRILRDDCEVIIISSDEEGDSSNSGGKLPQRLPSPPAGNPQLRKTGPRRYEQEATVLCSPKSRNDPDKHLEGYTIWVDAKIADGTCANDGLSEPLKAAGAKVVVSKPRNRNPNNFLILFHQGRQSTLEYAEIHDVPVVGAGWVEAISKRKRWVDFKPFQVSPREALTLKDLWRAEGGRLRAATLLHVPPPIDRPVGRQQNRRAELAAAKRALVAAHEPEVEEEAAAACQAPWTDFRVARYKFSIFWLFSPLLCLCLEASLYAARPPKV